MIDLDEIEEDVQILNNPVLVHSTDLAKLFEVDRPSGNRKKCWIPKKAIVEETEECVAVAAWCDIRYEIK